MGHLADDPALGQNLVTAPKRLDHRLVFLHLFLLRADQQEIHDREDQDQWHKAGKGGCTAAGGLCKGGSCEHRRPLTV